MKLKLKHIQCYDLTKLEFILSEKGIFNLDSEHGLRYEATKPMKIINIIFNKYVEIELYSNKTNWGVGFIELDEVKPILQPLSEAINVIRTQFSLYDKNGDYDKEVIEFFNSELIGDIDEINELKIDYLPHGAVKWLLKNMYDVYGLNTI